MTPLPSMPVVGSCGGTIRWIAAVMIAGVPLVGCGPRATGVTGLVTLDGEPLPAAVMQFFPIAPEGRTAATQTDENGRYRVDVSPLPMRVVISAQKVVGRVRDGDGEVAAVEDIVPERYRDQSSMLLKVEPRAGEVTTADFALSSDWDRGQTPPLGRLRSR